jgi:tRNA threonylcarbamoyladenosine biosynthesis protein TsaE
MRSKRLTAEAEADTIALGRALGRVLRGLDCVCLYGDLGAGKTTLTRGLAAALGYKGRVTSPTFGLAREYRGKRWSIFHLDLYRVGGHETGDIGLEEYLSDPRAVCVIEWPNAAKAYLPEDRVEVELTPRRQGGRKVVLRALGARSREILETLK